ncbi:WD40 repeat-like protein [Leucogyrophana mollusca]|uniref:WD40 repeat-like protein n=1 Tax=Leucogyrophana mollusca TaxID=85980 RepID=A0ACB8B4B0_9AGAM|nr:WD40 repeat-like protein [Leucogyrophana mollusca]
MHSKNEGKLTLIYLRLITPDVASSVFIPRPYLPSLRPMSTAPEVRESFVKRPGAHPPTKVFKGHEPGSVIWSVEYFNDGRNIASGSSDKTIRIWNVESGQQEGKSLIHDAEVRGIAISPDSRSVASRVVGRVVVWDVARREKVHEIKLPEDDVLTDFIMPVVYSPDGRCTGAVSRLGDKIHLWDSDIGALTREPLRCAKRVKCLAFSPNGAQIATGSYDGSFQVFDISTGKVVVDPIKGHTESVTSLVYSPKGRLIITGSRESYNQPHVTRLAVTVDGRRIASGSFDNVCVWDLETRLQTREPFGVEHGIISMAFSPDGRFVVGGSYGGILQLWDIESHLVPLLEGLQKRQPSLPVVSQARVAQPHQQKQQTNTHSGTSSLNSSVLDLPAVTQPDPPRPRERAPSVDNDWDSVYLHRQPIEHHQEAQPKQEDANVQPPSSGKRWTVLRDRWRILRPRKSRVHAGTPEDPALPPLSKLPTVRSSLQPTPDPARNASTQEDSQAPRTRIPLPPRLWTSFHRISARPATANVASGRDIIRLVIPPENEFNRPPSPDPADVPPHYSPAPSFLPMPDDPLQYWSWRRELRLLLCCCC